MHMKHIQEMELKLLQQLSILTQQEQFMLLLFINPLQYILRIFFNYYNAFM